MKDKIRLIIGEWESQNIYFDGNLDHRGIKDFVFPVPVRFVRLSKPLTNKNCICLLFSANDNPKKD